MTISAYLLIECSIDPADVVRGLRKLSGVKQAHALFGPLEAIAYVEGDDLEALGEVIASFYSIEGVKGTDTRIARAE